ncbi:MAG TPA: HAD family hydrolase [Spartobacteria bacterium]|jgi:D-glycero-D-manno-heptose 1,7-bisphosphate phosphatase|nr:HAD family hydrolase [Spartobacteria bacterium]HCP91151.1 HAD family hydrolase [Spartobacteria bacterium]
MQESSPTKKSRAVFVDRDGTIMNDADYCSDPKQVQVFQGAPEALRRLKDNGYKIIIVTNQSGIGRGFFTVEQYRAVEAEVLRQLGDGLIDATYFCPDVPGAPSKCRKPAPGMTLQAARDHDVDLARSFFIGDKEIDVECGRNAGVRTIRVRTGFDKMTDGSCADWVAEDLNHAADIILHATP